jgi:4-amino-4-deoxy-L-arabinose transferase-like glycosyltransferase
VQTALSASLIGSNTAFVDEADYLWAGRQILQSGLRPLGFETYFSGSPKIYPLLAAVVDSVGGLALARLLSLAFMLGVTLFVYGTAQRLFNRTAAFLSAGMFAVLAPTQFVGAFATYDAMALFLLSGALWCVVRSCDEVPREGVFVLAAAFLVLANMTKYATILYDPVVILIAVLLYARRGDRKLAIRRGLFIGVTVAVLGLMFLVAAGTSYWQGLVNTTLARTNGTDSTRLILTSVALWIGVLIAVTVVGLTVRIAWFWKRDRLTGAILVVMGAALFLAPISQLRIHTIQSLDKHVDFGAMFGVIVVGYVLSLVTGQRIKSWYRYVLPLGLVVVTGFLGVQQVRILYTAWPNSTQFMQTLHGLTKPGSEKYLVEDYDLAAYYMDPDINRNQWDGTISFDYVDPATKKHLDGVDAWTQAVRERYFAVIALSYSGNTYADGQIQKTIEATPGYVLVAKMVNHGSGYGTGYYWIWKRI